VALVDGERSGMFKVVDDKKIPGQIMWMVCDHPRCKEQATGVIPPEALPPEVSDQALLPHILGFYNWLMQKQGWLVLPHAQFCQEHIAYYRQSAKPASLIQVPSSPSVPDVLMRLGSSAVPGRKER
jgi:hypothetical protein